MSSTVEKKRKIGVDEADVFGQNTFAACKSLRNINLPSTLVEIGINAFYNCRSLEDIVFSEGLETIGGHAFNSCSLKSITLPLLLSLKLMDLLERIEI